MTTYPWAEFLTQWNREILASEAVPEWDLPAGAIEAGWLGFPPATEDQIAVAESRLGVKLPPSYREFLAVSNGWLSIGNPYTGGLLPVEEIERFPARSPAWFDIIRALPGMAGVDYAYPVSDEAFENAIEICAAREGTFLLNPLVVDESGEMEAWFFEGEIGVRRHPSFWGLMQAEYRLFSLAEGNAE